MADGVACHLGSSVDQTRRPSEPWHVMHESGKERAGAELYRPHQRRCRAGCVGLIFDGLYHGDGADRAEGIALS